MILSKSKIMQIIKSFLLAVIIFCSFSCEDKSFESGSIDLSSNIDDLSYAELIGAREYSEIVSASPFINSNGQVVYSDLISISKDDVELSDEFTQFVSIINPFDETVQLNDGSSVTIKNATNAGQITIGENNVFENYLTLKDSYLRYDEPTAGRDDTKNSSDNFEAHYNFKFKNRNHLKNAVYLSQMI